jgi:Putative Ig domain
MRTLSVAALFLASAVFCTAQTYTFDIIGNYVSPNGDPNSPFAASTFELRFTTNSNFFTPPSGPDFTTLTNITYLNNGVTRVSTQGSVVLCTSLCDGVESGGLDVNVSPVFPVGNDTLELKLSGPQLFSGTITNPTVMTGIFALSGGGPGGAGAFYRPAGIAAAVSNVAVIITVQSANGPVISSLSPGSALAGGPGFPLTVIGAGFQVGAVVLWNGTILQTAFTDQNHVIGTVPFNLIAVPNVASITVANPGPVISNAVPFAVNTFINGSLTILTPSLLPAGHIGAFYSVPLTATGGSPPYSFSLIAGTLPAGLSLSGSGVISGTPTVTTSTTFTVGVADSIFASASQSFSLTISPQTFDFTTALRVAQVVEGLNWKTLFIITNLDPTPTSYQFRFWDDNGNALALPLLNNSPGTLTGTLAAGGTTFAETPGNSPSLLQGWAEVASTGRLGVTAIFRSVIPGQPISEGTVTGVSSGSRVVLPFDNTQGFVTGVAVANTNANQSLTITLVFQFDTGAQIIGSLTLGPHAHTAFVLPTMFSSTAGGRGSILFTAPSPDVTVVGLSFSPTGSFTSLSSFQ